MLWDSICRIISESKSMTATIWAPMLRQPLRREATNQLGQSLDLISLVLIPSTIYDSSQASGHITIVGHSSSRGLCERGIWATTTGHLANLPEVILVLLTHIVRKLANSHQKVFME